jgi:hypothetical protein
VSKENIRDLELRVLNFAKVWQGGVLSKREETDPKGFANVTLGLIGAVGYLKIAEDRVEKARLRKLKAKK